MITLTQKIFAIIVSFYGVFTLDRRDCFSHLDCKKQERNTNTWGALALVIPLLSVLILLCLGKKKTQDNDGIIDD